MCPARRADMATAVADLLKLNLALASITVAGGTFFVSEFVHVSDL
ncbi:hypothetical protein FBPa19_0027 [Pseudomonas phage vB_PaeP_FBPa19]|uniref:Uncharacterized protein n=1 Tax=Pseudomonas phage vB_PaeP_FBPa42 TaxID=3231240 RepID=A0AAU8KXI4_9VIRU|nr:hypothetical protein FBPa19_0027 [Pseudomonas phage vB_PaeP_FBPa19]